MLKQNKKVRLVFITSLFFPFSAFSQTIDVSKWIQFVPSTNLPTSVITQKSNNNLDVIFFENRYYFAFRTAPTHFASKKTKLYIISSSDLKEWRKEKEIWMNSDLREPRFAVYNNKMYFIFFQGGKHPLKFEPKFVWVCTYEKESGWSDIQKTNLNGYVPWRIRVQNNQMYLSGYYGVNLYKSSHHADLRLFNSTDGINWSPISNTAQITQKGAEEGEFIFDNAGDLWGIVRLEGVGGGIIAYAKKDSIDKWQQTGTPYKHDSSLLFEHNNEVYLVSRRNLDGNLDHAPQWWPYFIRQKYNLLRYSFTKKRTALFHLNKQQKTLDHITDFSSTGDNAFPAIVKTGDNNYLLFNYSSNINKKEKNWIRGQLGKTYIYYTHLIFQP